MKLVDEAIDILSDANQPLANAFFKAQVIATGREMMSFRKIFFMDEAIFSSGGLAGTVRN